VVFVFDFGLSASVDWDCLCFLFIDFGRFDFVVCDVVFVVLFWVFCGCWVLMFCLRDCLFVCEFSCVVGGCCPLKLQGFLFCLSALFFVLIVVAVLFLLIVRFFIFCVLGVFGFLWSVCDFLGFLICVRNWFGLFLSRIFFLVCVLWW